jgi:hypothetical protein
LAKTNNEDIPLRFGDIYRKKVVDEFFFTKVRGFPSRDEPLDEIFSAIPVGRKFDNIFQEQYDQLPTV